MKQNLLTKVLLLFALIVGSVSSAWAEDVLVYTLDTSTIDGSGNGYANENTATVNDISWAVYGNLTENPWRIGGKSLNAVDRTARTTTKIGEAISKVALTIGNNSGITVNSMKLVVARDVEFNSQIDEVSATFAANSTINFTPSASVGTEWPKDAFYKFVFNVTVSGSSNKYFQFSKVEFYKTVSGPIDPTVSISTTTILVGGTAEISGPDGLSMHFSSDYESIATVDDDGVVTGVAGGTAKITASWSAVENTYNAGSKEFTVNVVEATVYEKVTNANQLVVGNEYILVATDNNMAMGGAYNNNKLRSNVAVTVNDNKVSITDEEVAVLTLDGIQDAWTFKASDNNEYLAYYGSSNEIYSSTDATADASMWIITNDFQLESANVRGRILKYNSGSPRFACYTSNQQKAVLFVKSATPPVSASITSAGYATFSSDKNVDFSAIDGLTVYTATDNGSSVTLNEVTSKQVPANKAVVLKGAEGTYEGTVIASAEELGANDLHISDGETATSDQNIYVLANKSNGVGFYKWVGTSSLSAGKIYLKAASSAPFLGFDGDDTTGIYSVERGALSVEGCYTLDGRRVAQPTKGLYIVNGKKVMIK